MGIFEGITHSEEIQELLNDAQAQYNGAKNRLENQKKRTTKSLEGLGKDKVDAWSSDMNKFLDSFGAFNNVQMVCVLDENYDFLGKNETPNELIVNMKNATYNADEILKSGALSVGTGALVGIATYGGVAMFANASTGTAIKTLKGVAKKNATLAWLGGGSIASGGAGIAGGTIVLGGVVIGAIAVVGGMIAAAQGQAKLSEAKKVHAEAEAAVSKMNVVITGMQGIEDVSNSYRSFISRLSRLFMPYLNEMDSIASRYPKGSDGKVDYNSLSEMEQKTLHLSWLLAQLYYHILSVPLLNEQGEIEPSSRRLLQKAQQDYTQLSGQATALENEKRRITYLLTEAKNMFTYSVSSYYGKKQATCNLLINIGKRRINLWETAFSSFINGLFHFENISVKNIYPYRVTDMPIEFIFESTSDILACTKQIRARGFECVGKSGLVEVALFGGEDFLAELSHLEGGGTENFVHKHDMSLWFAGELNPAIANNIQVGGVSEYYISVVRQAVDGISGRENLAQATAINQEVKSLSEKIKNAIIDFNAISLKTKNIETALKKYNKIQARFLREIDGIKNKYSMAGEAVHYDMLSEKERCIFEMAFVIAKIQYTILASCILKKSIGGDMDDSDIVIDAADKVYKTIQTDTFKMHDENNVGAADIVWREYADKSLLVGLATSVVFILLMILQLLSKNWMGLVGLCGAALAFPIFIYFKNLSQSKLFMWRLIRVIAAVIAVIVAEIIGLVV